MLLSFRAGNEPKDVIAGMNKLYPDRFNPAPLLLSAIKAFEGLEETSK